MLNIIHSKSNTVVLTALRDHPFATVPAWWAFVFKSSDNERELQCFVQDMSPNPLSYQRFSISGSTEVHDAERGVVRLLPLGMWTYSLWPATTNTPEGIIASGSPLSFGLLTVS
ncbi:MAG TPA: hypothetical protein VGE21_02640 [Flavobacteriales bacterium]